MEKEEIINLIKGRIEDEQRKHPLLDWSRIAAIKIYTEWFEYFNNENQELKEQMADKKYTEGDMRELYAYAKTPDVVFYKKNGSKELHSTDLENYLKIINKQD